MLTLRPAKERGHANYGWLDTNYTFSFGDYHDPKAMGFRALRVINEDHVAPGQGFGTHSHRNMEIITYVLEGAVEHRDSLGSGGVLQPGQIQHMSAGSGIRHSEFNPSPKDPTHLLQIWIVPEKKNLKPEYEQLAFPDKDLRGKFHHVAGPKAPVTIHQDADLFIARLDKNDETRHDIKPGRHAWMQVARGTVRVNDVELKQGDGAAISKENEIRVVAQEPSEVLLFDLA